MKSVSTLDSHVTQSNGRWFGALLSCPQLMHILGNRYIPQSTTRYKVTTTLNPVGDEYASEDANATATKDQRADKQHDLSDLWLLNVQLLLRKNPRRQPRGSHRLLRNTPRRPHRDARSPESIMTSYDARLPSRRRKTAIRPSTSTISSTVAEFHP